MLQHHPGLEVLVLTSASAGSYVLFALPLLDEKTRWDPKPLIEKQDLDSVFVPDSFNVPNFSVATDGLAIFIGYPLEDDESKVDSAWPLFIEWPARMALSSQEQLDPQSPLRIIVLRLQFSAAFFLTNCTSDLQVTLLGGEGGAAPVAVDLPASNTSPSPESPATVLTPEDEQYLSLLEAQRDQHFARAPLLSGFRVLALLSYEDLDGHTAGKYVVGANAECANIGGATCAERAAMAQLQLLPVRRVRKIYIVSDSPQCLTPGTLCREFLLSSPLISEDTPFVSRAKSCRPCVTTLAELYPFPSLYDRLPRSQVLPFARGFCSRFAAELQPQEGEELTPFVKLQLSRMTPDEQDVYLKALSVTEQDARDDLFPLRYAAGTKFSDGEVRVTWQHKTLEYGSSLDAISKLIPFVEDKQRPGAKQEPNMVQPEFLMQVDQFGILHAPFARARAYFFEFGFLDVPVLVHDTAGELHRVPIGTLVAESPDCIAASTAMVE
ncbi:unnamed protein product [Phytophthora lilii]|uniref:Unnamed protein product n=1 Tax=Phytophthora lilii TaxID=2077276 RepID=A0A9W6YHE5_9STRA|nr:unnamed protein product [Phytophthora lilii]